MHVYFYHTQNIQYCLDRMKDGEFPSHFLYGACHLKDNGIGVVWHRSPKKTLSRIATAIRSMTPCMPRITRDWNL